MLGIAVSTKSVDVTSSRALARVSDRVLDAHELGEIYLHRPAATIFKDLTRAPHRLPPSIKIPGRRGRLWLESVVVRWLEGHQEKPHVFVNGAESTEASRQHRRMAQKVQDPDSRRVGRPTKRQQLERRLAAVREGK